MWLTSVWGRKGHQIHFFMILNSLKVPQEESKIIQLLNHKLKLLQQQCEIYDQGDKLQALEMAGNLRLLFKDGGSSKSLFGQLNLKDEQMVDAKIANFGKTYITDSELFCIPMGGISPSYIPYLDSLPPGTRRRTSFVDWWTRDVLIDAKGNKYSRKYLVEVVAEQGGGVHVDPLIDVAYADLSNKNSMGYVTKDGSGSSEQVMDADAAAIRQIAHETLRTFVPDYPRQKMLLGLDAKAAASGVWQANTDEIPKTLSSKSKIGPNDPCPCGALKKDGKNAKYKKCCYRFE
jgi:hypothetical protein